MKKKIDKILIVLFSIGAILWLSILLINIWGIHITDNDLLLFAKIGATSVIIFILRFFTLPK